MGSKRGLQAELCLSWLRALRPGLRTWTLIEAQHLLTLAIMGAPVTFRKDVAGRRLFRPPGERVTSPWLLCHLAVH
jgi:hypothetical protein